MNNLSQIFLIAAAVILTLTSCGNGNGKGNADIPPQIIEESFLCDERTTPSCHASTIVELSDGELLAAWFGGSRESADDVKIFMSRKPLQTSWTTPQIVAQDPEHHASWNPVLFQTNDGDLLLFYKTGPYVAAWRGHMKRSTDGGITWSEPYDYDEALFGAIKDKPIQQKSGRIIAPSSDERGGKWQVHFEISDDNAKTWRKIGPIKAPEGARVIQPSIITLKDGTLRALCRSSNGYIAVTESHDNGDSWSDITFTDFPHNNSGIDVITTKTGMHLMVCNPLGLSENQDTGPRTPLSIMKSQDGLNWQKLIDLETDEGEYSYPAIIEGNDGTIHITYTWRREKIKYVHLKI